MGKGKTVNGRKKKGRQTQSTILENYSPSL